MKLDLKHVHKTSKSLALKYQYLNSTIISHKKYDELTILKRLACIILSLPKKPTFAIKLFVVC